MSDAPEIRPEDALQVAQRALARVSEVEERMDELEAENERLEYRVAELEAGLPDENTPYDQLDLDEKVGRVRRYLMKRADASPDGWAKIDYDDVMWSVFNGEPSADHCYKLMRLAANAEGFEYRDPEKGNKHVSLNQAAAKASAAFSHANKTDSEGVGR